MVLRRSLVTRTPALSIKGIFGIGLQPLLSVLPRFVYSLFSRIITFTLDLPRLGLAGRLFNVSTSLLTPYPRASIPLCKILM